MKMLRIALAWLLLTGSSCALAHAHLTQSTPADGAHLASAPAQLVLHFSEGAQLTALWIQKGTAGKHKLGPLPDKSQSTIAIALPALERGDYLVSWRVLAGDGHVAPGQVRFTIDR